MWRLLGRALADMTEPRHLRKQVSFSLGIAWFSLALVQPGHGPGSARVKLGTGWGQPATALLQIHPEYLLLILMCRSGTTRDCPSRNPQLLFT